MEKAKALFAREASILHQVQHPQIPRFWAAFEWEDRLFLAQDYIQGDNYRTLLQRRRDRGETLSEVEVLHLLNHLLPVLSYLHDRDIVHRDISPDNLVLSPAKGASENQQTLDDYTAGLPVLLDFGSVKAATSGLALVSSMTRVGKVGYAPPEQLQTGNVKPHSDLYALAVTGIVLLTGREPHQLLDSLTLDWNWQPYTRVSRELANILNKMLALHPADRYQSAKAVHSDLQRLLGVLTPMIWRPEYVSWQGFASPIHQRAATPIGESQPTTQNGGSTVHTVLPPTHLQMFRRKVGERFSQSLNPIQSGNVTLPPLTSALPSTIGSLSAKLWPPQFSAASSSEIPSWQDKLIDWSPRLAIAASFLMIGGIGLAIFRTPVNGIYRGWLQSSTTLPSAQPQPTVEATGPRTIEFAPGEVAAAVQGNLPANHSRIYQFRASKGQVSAITLEGAGVKMNLLRADQSPIDGASRQTRNWTGQLPASEQYQIQITGSGAYSLEMAISPNRKVQPKPQQSLDFSSSTHRTVFGEILSGKTQQYRFNAPEGKQFRFKVLQGDLNLRVLTPTGKPLGSSKNNWQGKTPIAGQYTVEIRSPKRDDYAISFELK